MTTQLIIEPFEGEFVGPDGQCCDGAYWRRLGERNWTCTCCGRSTVGKQVYITHTGQRFVRLEGK